MTNTRENMSATEIGVNMHYIWWEVKFTVQILVTICDKG